MALTDERRRLLDDTFDTTVADALFGDRTREDAPVAVLWVHPPWHAHGPGLDDLNEVYGGDLVVVDGQALRSALPDYDDAMHHPLTAQEATREDVGHLVGRGISHAAENGISVLVPGTGTRPAVTLGTAADFHDAGYAVHVVAVAEPMESTTLDAVYGYFDPDDPARVWPRPDNRAANWPGLRETVHFATQSPYVDRVVVTTKDGTVLSDTTQPGTPDPTTEFDTGRQVEAGAEDAGRWLQRCDQALAWAREAGELNELTLPVFTELVVHAHQLVAHVTPPERPAAVRTLARAVDATGAPSLRRALLAGVENTLARSRLITQRATAGLSSAVDSVEHVLSAAMPTDDVPAPTVEHARHADLTALRTAITTLANTIDTAIAREITTVREARP